MPVKTNILPVKVKCSNQLIKPLQITPTAHNYAMSSVECVHGMFLFWITCCQGVCWICCQASRCLRRPIADANLVCFCSQPIVQLFMFYVSYQSLAWYFSLTITSCFICEACEPTKQGRSDSLGKISFWYHCKQHTCSLSLIPKSSLYPCHILRYDHLCIRP